MDTMALVAHELRTPVHAIAAGAEMLAGDLEQLDPQRVRTMVQSIHRRALWLQVMIEDLLSAAAIQFQRVGAARVAEQSALPRRRQAGQRVASNLDGTFQGSLRQNRMSP